MRSSLSFPHNALRFGAASAATLFALGPVSALLPRAALAQGPAAGPDAGAPAFYAITNARIVTAPGKIIEKGTLVLKDGLIASIGTGAAPAGAKVIDGAGLTLYPGLVDAFSRLGMPTSAADLPAAGRGDAYPVGAVRAELTAQSLFKPDAAQAAPLRQMGFTAALAAPSLGVINGTSAVFSLADGADSGALLLKSNVALHTTLGGGFGFGGYPGSLMGEIAVARQAFSDAKYAAKMGDAYDRGPGGRLRPDAVRALDSIRPALEKKMPTVFRANTASEIRRALALADEFDLVPVIEGGLESYAVIDELKKARATVLLSTDLPDAPRTLPGATSTETLQGLRRRALAPTSAAALAKAQIPFSLTHGGLAIAADFSRNVRKLIAAGLTDEQALAALTTAPAKWLGIDRQTGTLETGKIGNIVAIENGPIFSTRARVKRLFIDGKPVTVETGAAPVAGGGRTGGGAAALQAMLAQLPPGVTPEMARQALTANPQMAARLLPPGVTVEQALAALSGNAPTGGAPGTNAPGGGQTPATPEADVTAPPATTIGPVPALPKGVGKTFVLRGATVWTSGPQGIVKDCDVLVRNGKIASIGVKLNVPRDAVEIDARGKHVTPGMIDCHSHTAIAGGVNEGSNIVTAECRIEDVIDPDDVNIYRQLAGGTTAANLLHGSANAIGGQNAVVKWRWGKTATQMMLDGAPKGIKFALGENPTRSNGGGPRDGSQARYPLTRMGVERSIRARFTAAKNYADAWKRFKDGKGPEPRREFQLDALVEILDGKRLVHCHSYRADEILMMVRIADDFGFKIATFQHVLEGYKVADELAKHGAGGSTFSDWWGFKIEAYDAIPYNGALMTQRGVVVSFNSDSSELARRMNLEAAKAVRWGGLDRAEALKLLTINPAKQLRIDKMTGSLESGKDADIVVWSGDPLSTATIAEKTFVDGELLFDRAQDLEQRKAIDEEKKRLTAALASPAGAGGGGRRPTRAPGEGEAPTATAPKAVAAWPASKPPAVTLDSSKPSTALVGATVHPVSGPEIKNGVVLIQNGRIVAVGSVGAVTIPANATRFDIAGKHVWPGMLDADTTLGVNEIESRRELQDYREQGTFMPELQPLIAINPDAETLMVARAEGILNAIVAPAGGTISGMAGLIHLDGYSWEEFSFNRTAALMVTFPGQGGRRFREVAHLCEEGASGPHDHESEAADPALRAFGWVPAGSRDADALRWGLLPEPIDTLSEALAQVPQTLPGTPGAPGQGIPGGGRRPGGFGGFGQGAPGAGTPAPEADPTKPLNDFLDEGRRYKDALAAGLPIARDVKFDALLPVLEGKTPLMVRASRATEIRAAIAWAKKEGFKIVIVGADEADEVADLLVRENVPVVLGPVMSLPTRADLPYDDAYTLPARLAAAGVRFCLSTGSAQDVRRLPNHAAMASSYGLDHDAAVRSVTLDAARIVGAGDSLGSIEVGKLANLLVTSGDLLEIESRVEQAFVVGKSVDLGNRQRRLYDKWRARPKSDR